MTAISCWNAETRQVGREETTNVQAHTGFIAKELIWTDSFCINRESKYCSSYKFINPDDS